MVSLGKPKKRKRALKRYCMIIVDAVLRHLGNLVIVRSKSPTDLEEQDD